MVMPVATPQAKTSAKSFTRKAAWRSWAGLPERAARVVKMATASPRPTDSGTNMKCTSTVKVNCARDKNTGSRKSTGASF